MFIFYYYYYYCYCDYYYYCYCYFCLTYNFKESFDSFCLFSMLEWVNVQCVALKSCWFISVVCVSAANIGDCRPLEFIMAVWFCQFHQHGVLILIIDTLFFSIFFYKFSSILSFRWLTSVMFNLGLHTLFHLTLCTVFVFDCCSHLTSLFIACSHNAPVVWESR